MRIQACLCPILSIFLGTFAIAQSSPSMSGGFTPGGGSSDPELTRPSIMLSGKVTVDDGTPPPGQVAIQTVCKGQKRIVTYSDSSGAFSFTLAEHTAGSRSMGASFDDASTGSSSDGLPIGGNPSPLVNSREWRECSVQAELAGYTSETVNLISRIDNRGGNMGSIKLSRIANVQGLTVSATSAGAPDEARKALEKGFEQEKKNKWDDALASFQKAVEVYPRYAVAWFELGRINLVKNDVAGAKASFSKSLEADPQYVTPYLGLAQIAAQEQKWQDMANLTAKVIGLNPVNFPNAWFFNGYANYSLGNITEAEKSARAGLKIDPEHHYPRLEYLLGMALMEEKDYASSSEHLQAFLHLVTDPREVAEAKKQIAEVVRLSASAAATAPAEKK